MSGAAFIVPTMTKTRLEAFSDGVIAILITIMVLELHVPHDVTWQALVDLTPVFLSYVLSFIYLGIYWNNHHHLLHAATRVSGATLWANLHLLFWLSLVPFGTAWMGENHFDALPTALYGVVLLGSSVAFGLLVSSMIRTEGKNSRLAQAINKDHKGKVSVALYTMAVPLAFVNQWFADAIYVAVAALWFVPDSRIERQETV